MAKKKKATRKKKSATKQTGARRSQPARAQKKAMGRKKVKPSIKRSRPKAQKAPKALKTKKVVRTARGVVPTASVDVTTLRRHGLGSGSAGQSGDTQGLSTGEWADSESVEELVEEGQDFEASVVAGVEDAPDADQGEVRTKQIREDDVPLEYLDKE
jgi:hypothetical protein